MIVNHRYDCPMGMSMTDGNGNTYPSVTLTCKADKSWIPSNPISDCECRMEVLMGMIHVERLQLILQGHTV